MAFSMNKTRLKDDCDVSDLEGDDEELVPSNEPYLYESVYTDEELREHLERRMAPHSLSVTYGPLDCGVWRSRLV